MLALLLSALLCGVPQHDSPVCHTELLASGYVLQIHADTSVTFTTVESVAPHLFPNAVPGGNPGEVEYLWVNTASIVCRARIDCVTLTYEDCVKRALALRAFMLKEDPFPLDIQKTKAMFNKAETQPKKD